MKIKFDTSGLKKLQREIERKAKSLSGSYDINELCNNAFMSKHTNLNSINQLFDMVNVRSKADYDALPQEDLDQAVRKISTFTSYQDMLNKASEELIARKWSL